MKAITIFYWIFTGLLCALMLFSAVMSFKSTPEGDAMLKHIGFTPPITHLLAVFKILGVIALLMPGLPRLKEWAYAGFTFDLMGAMYSFIVVGDPLKDWAFIIFALVLVTGSYICWRKRTTIALK
ncbi:DoxX family protein [Mucilaginibacter terrae]|uniref:Membrane protein YphA (DoxX/SURF4 family) n=1 Tax=Mucilaginibacter terrae TaxID=1955052 RepID=A0ABU3GPM3_9SPHI|nr:DoxX family protein [Mucilaginibacter terrae]MDT3401733.1 putative membrane protein YphA (DoxX/SURF4 family) [Mucilaginibacter terrae]